MTEARHSAKAARTYPGGPYDIFRAMVGREPNRGVRTRIEQVRSALDARDDDAIWVILAIFESAIDRGERVYRLYVRVLVAAVALMIAVATTTLYVADERLRSESTAMRSAVVDAFHQAECGGIGDPDACDVARRNADTPARRAVASVVSRLPDDIVTSMASFTNLDRWLVWMNEQAVDASARSAADSRTPGRRNDAR